MIIYCFRIRWWHYFDPRRWGQIIANLEPHEGLIGRQLDYRGEPYRIVAWDGGERLVVRKYES